MILGILLAMLTGLTWTAVGIVLSRSARDRFDIVAYSIMQTLTVLLLTVVFFVRPETEWMKRNVLLAIVILAAGFINGIAQAVTQRAMRQGKHGPIWAISQSALVVPFVFAALFFSSRTGAAQWVGVALVTLGILTPIFGDFKQRGEWFAPAIIAFLLFGAVQTLYLLPSYYTQLSDTAHMRPSLACLGNFSGWALAGLHRREPLRITKKLIWFAVAMAVLGVISLKMFFTGLDLLTQHGLGSSGIPLIVGANIAGFFCYALVVLRERNTSRDLVGLALALSGIVCLAL